MQKIYISIKKFIRNTLPFLTLKLSRYSLNNETHLPWLNVIKRNQNGKNFRNMLCGKYSIHLKAMNLATDQKVWTEALAVRVILFEKLPIYFWWHRISLRDKGIFEPLINCLFLRFSFYTFRFSAVAKYNNGYGEIGISCSNSIGELRSLRGVKGWRGFEFIVRECIGIRNSLNLFSLSRECAIFLKEKEKILVLFMKCSGGNDGSVNVRCVKA